VLALLLAAGSQVAIGASGAALTYVDLRAASVAQHRVAAPTWYRPNAPTSADGTFVPLEVRNGVVRGHLVSPAFWSAINDPQVSPNGWAVDFGRPMTEALVATVVGGAQGQRVEVQLFEHAALMQITRASSAANAGAGAPYPVPVGLDFLRTFGPPQMRDLTGQTAWSTGAVTLRAEAGETAAAETSMGANFPFTLQGGAQWVNGSLWYPATWQTPLRHGTGWLAASALTRQQPSGVANAGFDALDPALAAYLAGFGGRVGAVVYDESRGITYQYNPSGSFIVASSVKVPIMLALFTKLEVQGRDPDNNEMYLLTTMIENSNNDSAQALYEEIGDAPGLGAFMAGVHIGGLNPSPGTWGWSTITPPAMVSLLALLQQGKILTAAHRALALSLMEHIESDQQTGVGSTAPQSAVVAMKDGWVPGPDGLWAMNSSGIVAVGSETYIISVYTQDDNDLSDGWGITQHVCSRVAQLLT
jgi:hypothetical protein